MTAAFMLMLSDAIWFKTVSVVLLSSTRVLKAPDVSEGPTYWLLILLLSAPTRTWCVYILIDLPNGGFGPLRHSVSVYSHE
jgi:hypothetical protein